MKARILEQCEKGGVSFVELEMHVPDFEGDYMFGYGDNNVYMWFGMSRQAMDCIDELLKESKITAKRSSVMVYAIDGKVPTFEVAKRPFNHKYKTPRWLPIVFWIGKD